MQQFRGKLTAGLALVTTLLVVVMVSVEEAESAAMFDQDSAHFKAQQKSCSTLCGYCPSCNGFYCGEECICECQQADAEHVQCINKIKENSDKLGLIYDVLIQLPKSLPGGSDSSDSTSASQIRFARSAAPGDKYLSADEEATFRKVLELAQLPVWLAKMPLQTRISMGGRMKTTGPLASSKSQARRQQQQPGRPHPRN